MKEILEILKIIGRGSADFQKEMPSFLEDIPCGLFNVGEVFIAWKKEEMNTIPGYGSILFFQVQMKKCI